MTICVFKCDTSISYQCIDSGIPCNIITRKLWFRIKIIPDCAATDSLPKQDAKVRQIHTRRISSLKRTSFGTIGYDLYSEPMFSSYYITSISISFCLIDIAFVMLIPAFLILYARKNNNNLMFARYESKSFPVQYSHLECIICIPFSLGLGKNISCHNS